MNSTRITIGGAFDFIRNMMRTIQDVEVSLKQLRGGRDNWEESIENDERESIKYLYSHLKQLRRELKCYRSVIVEASDDQENKPGDTLSNLDDPDVLEAMKALEKEGHND